MHRVLQRRFSYNAWANRRVAESIKSVSGPRENLVRLLGHVLNAELIWLGRLLGENGPLPWTERTLEECDQIIEGNDSAYSAFLANGSNELDRVVHYQTSQGAPFQTEVGDILEHVLMHGCYHRGQIATAVKAAGGEPAGTDFILFVREVGGAAAP